MGAQDSYLFFSTLVLVFSDLTFSDLIWSIHGPPGIEPASLTIEAEQGTQAFVTTKSQKSPLFRLEVN